MVEQGFGLQFIPGQGLGENGTGGFGKGTLIGHYQGFRVIGGDGGIALGQFMGAPEGFCRPGEIPPTPISPGQKLPTRPVARILGQPFFQTARHGRHFALLPGQVFGLQGPPGQGQIGQAGGAQRAVKPDGAQWQAENGRQSGPAHPLAG